tara:strand:+ start:1015 stop:1410 length:396 start_codon:yes stop_codon:yes gene_type:complete
MNTILLLLISIIILNIGFSAAKTCNINDILYIFLIAGILSIIMIILNGKNDKMVINKNILIAGICILIGYSIFIYVIQKNEISKMTCYANIFGILFITAIGVIYFKEKLNIYNYIGISLLCIGIYLLSMKK